jgi:hypothetical protein
LFKIYIYNNQLTNVTRTIVRVVTASLFAFVIFCCDPKEKVLTLKDYQTFGNRLIKHFNSKKYDNVLDLYNQRPAYQRILQLYKASENDLSEENIRLIKINLYEHFDKYLKNIISGVKETRYSVSKVYIENQIPHVVIAFQNEKGFNFLDFELMTSGSKTQITDFYDYNVGDNFSNLFVQNQLYKVTGVHLGGYGNKKAMIELSTAQSFLQKQDYKKAWIAFNKIEYDYQWGKATQMTKLEITRHLSDSLYQEAMIDCVNAYYREDKFRLMKKFQFYYDFKKNEDALLTLDSLTSLVGVNFVTQQLEKRLKTN